jgi:hypothetical protein
MTLPFKSGRQKIELWISESKSQPFQLVFPSWAAAVTALH